MALSQYWLRIQRNLSPWLEEELGELTVHISPQEFHNILSMLCRGGLEACG